MVLLDQQMAKGADWVATTRLDLTIYQKLLSVYLYISSFSDRMVHIMCAWIRGELIRYAKRSSTSVASRMNGVSTALSAQNSTPWTTASMKSTGRPSRRARLSRPWAA